jgi:hypothetical protein
MCYSLYTWRIHQSERAAPLVYNSRGEWRINHQSQVGQRKRKTPIQSCPQSLFRFLRNYTKEFFRVENYSRTLFIVIFLKVSLALFVRVAV